MKKILIAVLAAVLAAPLFAFEQDKRSWFEIGYEMSDYTYREPHMDTPISIKGRMQGFNAKYTYLGFMADKSGSEDTFLTVDFRYMAGSTDYDGWLQSTPPTPHTVEDIGDYYWEGRVLFGQAFYATDSLSLLPYFGLGYRFLRDHSGKSEGGYDRDSHYIYIPLGADVKWNLGGGWTWALNAEFDWFFKGRQISRMSDVDPNYSDVSNQQDQGYGLRLSTRFQKDFARVGVFVEPFWRYWHIQNSDWQPLEYKGMLTPYALKEPFNTTREYGLKAGLVF